MTILSNHCGYSSRIGRRQRLALPEPVLAVTALTLGANRVIKVDYGTASSIGDDSRRRLIFVLQLVALQFY